MTCGQYPSVIRSLMLSSLLILRQRQEYLDHSTNVYLCFSDYFLLVFHDYPPIP